jgi:hypothetical protein
MLDQAKLAIVAYAQVSGADGSSTKTNSGITTTLLAMGTYALNLPVASQNQIGLEQISDRDLIFVQPLNATTPIAVTAVNKADQTQILVFTGSSATTAVNCDFSVLILRTVTPPVLGGPA